MIAALALAWAMSATGLPQMSKRSLLRSVRDHFHHPQHSTNTPKHPITLTVRGLLTDLAFLIRSLLTALASLRPDSRSSDRSNPDSHYRISLKKTGV